MSDEEIQSSPPASIIANDQPEEPEDQNDQPENELKESSQTKSNFIQDSQNEHRDRDIAIKDNICVNAESNEIHDAENEHRDRDIAIKDNICVNAESNEIHDAKNENAETNNYDISDEADKINTSDPHARSSKSMHLLQKIEELDEKHALDYLKGVSEDELLDALKKIEQTNSYLCKENELYELILNEDDAVQSSLNSTEGDEDLSVQESLVLSYPAKCYFAKKKLEHIDKEFELKKAGFAHELQNLNFELESLNMSLKDLSESKEKFDKNIRTGGRHPVTKKIILQKVAKFFDDSIRNKMALTNRYRIQIQSDIKERNKILSQIKAQEKRLSSLDMTEFQEAQFEHKKSCRELAKYKEQLGKLKVKFSPLLQSITEMKRALEREENEMEQMKSAVSKLEHLKDVMVKEKARNDQKVQELKVTMRKIKLDPRRHNLPEVIDYAAAKRENAALMRNINKWKKKVELVKQEKFLYLSALSKKNMSNK